MSAVFRNLKMKEMPMWFFGQLSLLILSYTITFTPWDNGKQVLLREKMNNTDLSQWRTSNSWIGNSKSSQLSVARTCAKQ